MIEELEDLLSVAEFLDDAVFMTATLLFGVVMLLLLKRKKAQQKNGLDHV